MSHLSNMNNSIMSNMSYITWAIRATSVTWVSNLSNLSNIFIFIFIFIFHLISFRFIYIYFHFHFHSFSFIFAFIFTSFSFSFSFSFKKRNCYYISWIQSKLFLIHSKILGSKEKLNHSIGRIPFSRSNLHVLSEFSSLSPSLGKKQKTQNESCSCCWDFGRVQGRKKLCHI